MTRSYDSLTLEEAKRMLTAAEAKAMSLGIPYNIAIVDAGGHLLAFVRQDNALIGSIDLAIHKAATARIFDRSTAELAQLAQSGQLIKRDRLFHNLTPIRHSHMAGTPSNIQQRA